MPLRDRFDPESEADWCVTNQFLARHVCPTSLDEMRQHAVSLEAGLLLRVPLPHPGQSSSGAAVDNLRTYAGGLITFAGVPIAVLRQHRAPMCAIRTSGWRPNERAGRKGAASAPACRGRRETPRFRPFHKPRSGPNLVPAFLTEQERGR
jgi:hypothetical protein